MRSHRLMVWLLSALFAALCFWWLFHIPWSPARFLSAVPAEATLLTVHRDVPERWAALVGSPLIQSLLVTAGLEPEEMQALLGETGLGKIVQFLRPREIACAHVPRLGVHQEPAWILAVWLGGRSQLARAYLGMAKVPGLQRQRWSSNRSIWTLTTPIGSTDLRFSFLIEEGVLMGCLSQHPETLYSVLQRFKGQGPSVGRSLRETVWFDWLAESPEPDRGWVQPAFLAGGGSARDPWLFAFEDLGRPLLAGRARPRLERTANDDGFAGRSLDGLGRIFGDMAHGMVLGDVDRLMSGGWFSPPWAGVLREAAADAGAREMALVLLGDEQSGRLHGIRIPALAAVFAVPEEEAALAEVRNVLDRLNVDHQWGLFPAEERMGPRRVYGVSSSDATVYGTLPADERAGFALLDGHLVVCSSMDVLRRIVARFDWEAAQAESDAGGWRKRPLFEESPFAVWFDLARSAETIRKGLYARVLLRMATGGAVVEEEMDRAQEVKGWLQTASTLGELWIWREAGEWRFEVGPMSASAGGSEEERNGP